MSARQKILDDIARRIKKYQKYNEYYVGAKEYYAAAADDTRGNELRRLRDWILVSIPEDDTKQEQAPDPIRNQIEEYVEDLSQRVESLVKCGEAHRRDGEYGDALGDHFFADAYRVIIGELRALLDGKADGN